MQTITEKRYKLIPVTDLDIMYVGGLHDTITYGAQDYMADEELWIRIHILNDKTAQWGEKIICLKHHMLSYKFRDRMLRVEDKSPLPVIEGEASEPANG